MPIQPAPFLPGPGPLILQVHPQDLFPAPPLPVVSEDPNQRRQRQTPDPVLGIHGFDTGAAAPVVTPPSAVVVDAPDQRRQRAVLDPIALSGVSSVRILPPEPTVVERVDQRDRYRGDVFIASRGTTDVIGTPYPPAPLNVDRVDRRDRYIAPPPVTITGVPVDQFAPPQVNPPGPVNVDRLDQRDRYRTPDPFTSDAAYQSVVPPVQINPPAPFVVPVEERRRFLAALPPQVSVGFDDVRPPSPKVVDPDARRRQTPDPFSFGSGAAAAQGQPQVNPPAPFVVPIDDQGRFRIVLPATGQHGFVAAPPGAVFPPPPIVNIDRVDQRVRLEREQPFLFKPPVIQVGATPAASGQEDIVPVLVAIWEGL